MMWCCAVVLQGWNPRVGLWRLSVVRAMANRSVRGCASRREPDVADDLLSGFIGVERCS